MSHRAKPRQGAILPPGENLPAVIRDGYDVAESKGNRRGRPVLRVVRHESQEATPTKAARIAATAHDAVRNMAIVAWAVNTHIDHVAPFRHEPDTGSGELDKFLSGFLDRASLPENFDVAGLLSRDEAVRMFEYSCLVDGDCGWLLAGGGYVQGIEGSRIFKDATDKRLDKFDHDGIMRQKATAGRPGRHVAYAVCSYPDNSATMRLDKIIQADEMIYGGWFRRYSQGRGVSPLTPSLITFTSLYDGAAYTLLKMQLHAMLGVVVKREQGDPKDANDIIHGPIGTTYSGETKNTAGATVKTYDVAIKDGIAMFDLEPGEDVTFLDSDTPSPNVGEFHKQQTRLALKCLGIPYSMYDPTGANYAQRKADAQQYAHATAWRRKHLADVLRRWTVWRLQVLASSTDATGSRFRDLVRAAGIELAEVGNLVKWVAAEVSSLAQPDPNEIAAKIALGMETYEAAAAAVGRNFYENCRANERNIAFANDHNVPLPRGVPGQVFSDDDDPAEPDEQEESEE